MRHWRLSPGSIAAKTEPNHGGRCQPKDAPGSQPLRKHGGPKQKGSRNVPSLANEKCQHRLGARSRRLKGSVGPNSSETLRMIAPPGCEHHVGRNAVRRGTKAPRLGISPWALVKQPLPREAVFFGSVNSLPVVRPLVSDGRLVQGCSPFDIRRSVPCGMLAIAVCSP